MEPLSEFGPGSLPSEDKSHPEGGGGEANDVVACPLLLDLSIVLRTWIVIAQRVRWKPSRWAAMPEIAGAGLGGAGFSKHCGGILEQSTIWGLWTELE